MPAADTYVCDVPEDLGRPLQLLLRDRYDNVVDVLDVAGPREGAQGVCLLEGYEGFYHAKRTQVDNDEGAYQEGAEPTPYPRIEKRTLKFVLGTQAEDPGDWEDIETRLWRFLTHHRDGCIRVYSVRSGWREVRRVRLINVVDRLARVPGLLRFGVWEIEAVAYDPWWHSTTLTRVAARTAATHEVNPATGAAQPGSGVWEIPLEMLNPADTRCFPEFASNTITAPVRVWLPDGLSGRMVAIHGDNPLGAGKEFWVQTDPLKETLSVRDDGQDWANMRSRAFTSWIRPGKVSASAQKIWVQGAADDFEITAYYPQQWDRMFGGQTPPHLEGVEWTGPKDM